jgi:23S rRNA pseudouridine2605 synthase
MRVNKYIAAGTALSRRAADTAIAHGRVQINGALAEQGSAVEPGDTVTLDHIVVEPPLQTTTVMFNKPVGYICSRDGQGNTTIYDILPPEYRRLNPVGRLDKDSSGLLLLTNDGALAQELTHPRYQKTKIYEVVLNKPLQPLHQQMISDIGVQLEDGRSSFMITQIERGNTEYEVTLREGRNRQIRRTFAALGYAVTRLNRTHFGPYALNGLPVGKCKILGTSSENPSGS